jgi:hypothetical protein
MNEMNEIQINMGNFFKLNDSRRKGFSLWRKRQNGRPNHVPPRDKGIKLSQKTTSFKKITFFEEKGTKFLLGILLLGSKL